MKIVSETLDLALRQFSSSDETTRGEGFTKLVERSRPCLHSMLAQSLHSESDREDVIGEVFQRVWKIRDRLEFETTGAWWRFLRTMTRNCAIDHRRTVEWTVNVDDPDWHDLPADEIPAIDALVELLEDRRLLYRLADEVFLGIPVDMPEHLRTRYLLAAKLLLIDRLPWQTVCRLVNSCSTDSEMVGRADLDRLLTTGWVLKYLAYSELHWDNEPLSEHVMAVAKADGSNPSWTEAEILAIQLRFRYAMLIEQIVPRLTGRIKKSDLIALFDSCVARFPFIEIMERLRRAVGPIKGAREQFTASGLWNRLVFQYVCHNGLPHRDILDRTVGAASVAGYDLTPGKLNVGLSNGRIFKKLAEHHEERTSRC